MIRVRFEENRLTVCGHAGYAARGEDIVCAAVSALVYALIGDLQDRGLVRELVIRPGYVMLCAGGACAAEFALVRCGLEQLQARYGEFVSVETTVHGS